MAERGLGENRYDQVCKDVIAANKAAELMLHFSEELRKQTDELEYRIKRMVETGLKEVAPLSILLPLFERKRELRNMMELGSFSLSIRRALEDAWEKLP